MHDQLTFLSPAHHANRSQLPDSEKAWMMLVATSRCDLSSLLELTGRDGSCGKTSLESCQRTKDGALVPSSGRWQKSGMGGPTGSWTFESGESHIGAVACSWSGILEAIDMPSPLCLTNEQLGKMAARLVRHNKTIPPFLASLVGPATQPQSSALAASRRSGRSKVARASESLLMGLQDD